MDVRTDAFLALSHNSGIGVGLVYSRRIEAMQFKTYGTTDQIYYTLIDYANRHGERETFGTEGFTDSKNRLPLLSEHIGVTAQAKYDRMFADITFIDGVGCYTHNGVKMMFVLAKKRESNTIFRLIKDIDPKAFVSQSAVIGVFGEGFDRIKVK